MRVKRGSLVVAFLLFASVFYATLTMIPMSVKAATLYVGGTGPGNFTTIQSAINAANVDDTIFVYNGTYVGNIVVGKRLSLVGEDRNTTVIDGGGSSEAVTITASGVGISGFTVTNSTDTAISVMFNADNSMIVGNNISGNNCDGVILGVSSGNTVSDNVLMGNGDPQRACGVVALAQSSGNSIFNNNISKNDGFGIVVDSSSGNIITKNNVSNNLALGLYHLYSDDTTMSNNTFSDNGYGIYLVDSSRISIGNNGFVKEGVFIRGSLLEHWNTHTIDTSNTVNGKPVHYCKNTTGGTTPLGAGQVILADCHGVVVENQNTSESTVGIQLGFSSGNLIANNTLFMNSVYGMTLFSSDGNTVLNNTILSTGLSNVTIGREGISLEISDSNTMAWNNVSLNNGRGAMFIHSNNSIISNNIVSNNTDGVWLWESEYNTILNNTIFSNNGRGVILLYTNNDTVLGNYISKNSWGVTLVHAVDSTLTNNEMIGNGVSLWQGSLAEWNTHSIDTSNTVNGKPVYYWKDAVGGAIPPGAGQVILANCTDVKIENQNVTNGTVGIQVGYSVNITIANNTASSNYFSGIHLYASSNNTLLDNNASSASLMGIALVASSGNSIKNGITSDSPDGISLWTSHYNAIINNTIEGNDYGFSLVGSGSNALFDNVISRNSAYGVHIEASDSNRVYHNRFLNNTVQAFDKTGTNRWDDGYPSGGNYWSDYAGFDIYRGPNQDIPGNDGIGDTPYDINVSNMDRYPLISPGTVYISPPRNVTAILSGPDLENVTVMWEPSQDESGGLVERYDVYRGLDYNISGSLYQQIGSVQNGTYLFVDYLAGEGNSSTYFYIVCSANTTNSSSCADNQAGKFTRPLSMGLNLVSVPLIQSNETIQTVLQTVSYDNAWSYDSINQEWEFFMKSKPYGGTLEYVNHTMGFWVNVTQDSNLTVAGVVPTTTTINLQAGWNLVGFPSIDDNHTVQDLKAAIAVERIEGFDGLALPYFLRVMTDGDFLQAGFGYWIRVDTETVWTVENM